MNKDIFVIQVAICNKGQKITLLLCKVWKKEHFHHGYKKFMNQTYSNVWQLDPMF